MTIKLAVASDLFVEFGERVDSICLEPVSFDSVRGCVHARKSDSYVNFFLGVNEAVYCVK